MPTLVDIAGGPKGDGLKKQIEAGGYAGIVKTTLDGVDQRDYLEGKTEKSARDVFFYYSSSHPSAVRYKNWKMYFAIAPETATGFVVPGVQTQFAAGMVNLKRDPFEMGWGEEKKANFWIGGALAGPVTAYIYDWNLLPIGQVLWLKELETYIEVPAPSVGGELQPGSGHGRAQADEEPPEPVASCVVGRAPQAEALCARACTRAAQAPSTTASTGGRHAGSHARCRARARSSRDLIAGSGATCVQRKSARSQASVLLAVHGTRLAP